MGNDDRTNSVLQTRKFLTKKNLMLQMKDKCESLQTHVNKFYIKFFVLQQKGLPYFINSQGKMVTKEDYQRSLHKVPMNK